MRNKLVLIFAVLFFVGSLFAFGYKYEETIEKSFKTGPDHTFKIENCNGNIEIVTHNDNIIQVEAEKYSDREEDFRKTEVVFKEDGKKLKIYIKRPNRHCRASVRFFIKIPHHLSLTEIETVNGSVELEGSFKDVTADTVNGKISFKGACKDAEMETVNGSIGMLFKKVIEGDLSVETVNGSVKLELEKGSSFNLAAETVNGSIKTDYDISSRKKFIGSEAEGTVNKGNYDIKVKTVNGSIRILEN